MIHPRWDPIAGANWYSVYRATSCDSCYTIQVTISSTSWNDTDVAPGVTYYYKVRARGSGASNSRLSPFTACESGYARNPSPPPSSPPLAPVPFNITSSGFWDFVFHCQGNWRYEVAAPGELVQDPSTSFVRMAGDCDDFATMIEGMLRNVGTMTHSVHS